MPTMNNPPAEVLAPLGFDILEADLVEVTVTDDRERLWVHVNGALVLRAKCKPQNMHLSVPAPKRLVSRS